MIGTWLAGWDIDLDISAASCVQRTRCILICWCDCVVMCVSCAQQQIFFHSAYVTFIFSPPFSIASCICSSQIGFLNILPNLWLQQVLQNYYWRLWYTSLIASQAVKLVDFKATLQATIIIIRPRISWPDSSRAQIVCVFWHLIYIWSVKRKLANSKYLSYTIWMKPPHQYIIKFKIKRGNQNTSMICALRLLGWQIIACKPVFNSYKNIYSLLDFTLIFLNFIHNWQYQAGMEAFCIFLYNLAWNC